MRLWKAAQLFILERPRLWLSQAQSLNDYHYRQFFSWTYGVNVQLQCAYIRNQPRVGRVHQRGSKYPVDPSLVCDSSVANGLSG